MALTKITSTNIGANAVTSALIANVSSATITSGLGYTPANKAGDTFTGAVAATTLTANGASAALTLADRSDLSKNFVWYVSSDVARLYNTGYDLLKVNTAGFVTMPYQPRFHATGNGGSSTSGGLAQFPTVKENIGSYYSNSTMRFTAPIAGTYFFYGAMMASTGTGRMIWKFYKNGSSSNGYMQAGGDSTNYGNWPAAMIMTLAVNDYITMVVEAGTTYNSNQEQYFGGYLLG